MKSFCHLLYLRRWGKDNKKPQQPTKKNPQNPHPIKKQPVWISGRKI